MDLDTSSDGTAASGAHPITILISHNNNVEEFRFPPSATVSSLQDAVSSSHGITPEHQKLIAPKLGILRDPSLPITSLPTSPKKIILMGSSSAVVSNAKEANAPDAHRLRKFGGTGPIAPARPAHRRDWKRESEDNEYTFHRLNPLQHLPNPSRSMDYLQRLKEDPGIRATMRKHKWSVPLLSEMDPAEHTTHESRTLGLNKNGGEEILLRLRTDGYDGYRHYDTVRKTLCHELAHNVHSEHDRHFWDLYKIIVTEVERSDWASGSGRTISGIGGSSSAMSWAGDEEEKRRIEKEDGGGLTGGSFRLGGSSSSSGGGSVGGTITAAAASSGTMGAAARRENAARAAEARMKKAGEGSKEGNAGA